MKFSLAWNQPEFAILVGPWVTLIRIIERETQQGASPYHVISNLPLYWIFLPSRCFFSVFAWNSWCSRQSQLASGDKTFIGRMISAVISKGIVVTSYGERKMGKRILKESRDFKGEWIRWGFRCRWQCTKGGGGQKIID